MDVHKEAKELAVQRRRAAMQPEVEPLRAAESLVSAWARMVEHMFDHTWRKRATQQLPAMDLAAGRAPAASRRPRLRATFAASLVRPRYDVSCLTAWQKLPSLPPLPRQEREGALRSGRGSA